MKGYEESQFLQCFGFMKKKEKGQMSKIWKLADLLVRLRVECTVVNSFSYTTSLSFEA